MNGINKIVNKSVSYLINTSINVRKKIKNVFLDTIFYIYFLKFFLIFLDFFTKIIIYSFFVIQKLLIKEIIESLMIQ